LDVTEKFVNTLLDAGVKSVDTLERTRLASEKGGTVAPKPASAASTNKKNVAPIVPQGAPVLDRYTIKCIFTCDSGPLQNVMNNLANPAKTPQFLAVRMLRVENTKQEAPTKEEIRAIITKNAQEATTTQDTAAPAPKTPVPNAPRLVPVAKAAPADAAEIMGGEDLKVYMEVDYIRFRKLDGGAAPSGPVSKK
jgi:hypothetical protein